MFPSVRQLLVSVDLNPDPPIMNNIPLTNIAVSLSGGGYRATTFHLGALCLLDAIELEAGNRLIQDEEARKAGATLLENVRIISTISGGTLTGVMYALKLAKGGDFKECFFKLYDQLDKDDLVELALDKLNSPGGWKNRYKNRNLINAFSEVYNEHFYDGATFGDLYQSQDVHLTDAIFGASEFTAGLQYRFQESGSGDFGSGDLYLPKEIAERIRLADAAASSSCFPGGFEPMTMPTDFSNGPESRVEEWWTNRKINFDREATIAQLKAREAAATAANTSGAPELINPILAAVRKANTAEQQLHRARAKAQKTAQDAQQAKLQLAVAEADEQEAARLKVEATATEAATAKAALEKATATFQKANQEFEEVAAANPQLAAVLAASEKAAQEAAAAQALADETVDRAEKAAEKTKKAAEKAAADATTALELSRQQSAQTAEATENKAHSLALAEDAAAEAEKATEKAKDKAVEAAEAAADLALIMAERAVEYASQAHQITEDALRSANPSPSADEVYKAAEKANAAAKAAVERAKAAASAAQEADQQKQNCYDAVSIAENASTEVASYSMEKAEQTYSKKRKDHSKFYKGSKSASYHLSTTTNTRQLFVADDNLRSEERRKAMAVKAAIALEMITDKLMTDAQGVTTASSDQKKALEATKATAAHALKLAVAAEKAASFARRVEPHHPITAIMDGGILDNQGIRGVALAEKRYSKDGKLPPFIGTYIISDVSGKKMAPYEVPSFSNSSFKNFFSLERVNWIATALLAAMASLLIFVDLPKWGTILTSFCATILLLWFVIYWKVRSVFRTKVAETFAGEGLTEIRNDLKVLVKTPLYIIIHLLAFRATSSMKMISDVFLRRIRRLQIHGLYKSSNWNYRIVSNNIYELKDAQKLTPALKKVIDAANNMPTTLWFSQQEKRAGALDDLIACGQLTLCSNLIDYLQAIKKGKKKARVWDQATDYQAELDEVLELVEFYWQRFRVDPYWLIKKYKAERGQN